MSHVSLIALKVRDLDTLAGACPPLGLEFVRGQKTYKWFGRSLGDAPLPEGMSEAELGHCDHAIRVKDDPFAYEIGVARRPGDDHYSLLWDFWQGGFGLEAVVGKSCGKLKQAYAAGLARKEARRRGYSFTESTLADGALRLVLRQGARP